MAIRFKVSSRSSKSPLRVHNEDTMLQDLKRGIFILSDGLGGHQKGEVASSFVVSRLARILTKDVDQELYCSTSEALPRLERLLSTIQEVNQKLFNAIQDKHQKKMGATLCILMVCGKDALCAHVGDSPAVPATSFLRDN